ncbi:MAG TPA: hypothetical protein VHG52_07535 [Thermomicrobiales bacterium]|nr:hypothetical protein [Thermomicrobiales bacterium]
MATDPTNLGSHLMARSTRLALLAAMALILVVAGTVLATRQPQAADQPSHVAEDGDGTPATAEELAHAAERLRANGIAVDDAVLRDLGTRYGLGGAVRVIAWAANPDDDITIDSIAAMRDGDGTEGSEMGWGRIAKHLGLHPGIGSIMGNGAGHGRDSAPGQQENRP